MGRHVTIGNPPIGVELRRSARAKRLSLRISRLDGRITLTVPQRAPEREALAFLDSREDWLRGHLADVATPQTPQDGGTILFRGATRTIAQGGVKRVALEGDTLQVPDGPIAPRLKAFLKTEARDALAAASDRYAAQIGQGYSRISLRDTRSRWGSCSSKGVLMYSWRLIMAPPDVLDYVAAHEVAHLLEMNHSGAFWDIVARLMPEYDTHRVWLRTQGDALHRVRFDD